MFVCGCLGRAPPPTCTGDVSKACTCDASGACDCGPAHKKVFCDFDANKLSCTAVWDGKNESCTNAPATCTRDDTLTVICHKTTPQKISLSVKQAHGNTKACGPMTCDKPAVITVKPAGAPKRLVTLSNL